MSVEEWGGEGENVKKGIGIFVALSLVFIVGGCATVQESVSKKAPQVAEKPLYQMEIRTADGASTPSVAPGESVTLVAKGMDEDGNEVSVSPMWSADMGTVTPKQGKKVSFSLPSDASGIMTFVTAKQGEVEGNITIQISQ